MSSFIINPYSYVTGTTLKTGLVSIWELEEASGSTAYDSYGTNNLTNTGLTVGATGIIGRGYSNTGVTSYHLNYGSNLITGFPFSTSIWFYSYVSNPNVAMFFSNYNASYYGILVTVSNTLCQMQYGDGTGAGSSDRKSWRWPYTFLGSTWYNLVATGSSLAAADNKYYINGTALTGQYLSGTATTVSWASGYTTVISPVAILNGIIDQATIWNKVLTQAEVDLLWNSGNGLAYSSW